MSKAFDTKRLVAIQRGIISKIKSVYEEIILRHLAVVRTLLLILGALTSLAVVGVMLFTNVSDEGVVERGSARLNSDTIDELELYIETRQTTYENPQVIPPRVFGL